MKRFGMTVAALIGVAPSAGAVGSAAQTSLSTQGAPCRPGSPVDRSGYVEIGGIRQWVTIKGRDCANPVLLIVHGGPGNPTTPFADALYGSWTRGFTLVQWDQRGAGMTYMASPPAEGETLTVARLTQDGVEVARHATRQLGKRKVILMGGSWGSALAVHMAQAAPDLFSAYVGTSQLVDDDEDMAAGYDRSLRLARAAGDRDSIAKLEEIGRPPWSNPRNFGIFRRVTRIYEARGTDAPPATWFRQPAPGYDTPAYQAAYEAGEDYSYLQFVGLSGNGMASTLHLAQLGTRFRMPVVLLQGDQDLVTPPEISRRYFESLTAPRKEFIRLPRTGHDLNQTMVTAQFEVMSRLRPLAVAADQDARRRR